MKNVILVMFFLASFKQDVKMKQSDKEPMLKVTKILGTKEDIKKILFLVNVSNNIKTANIIVKYEQSLGLLSFLLNKRLIGYYIVEKKNGQMIINNDSLFKQEISFIDPEDREYQLEIESVKDNILVFKIINYGNKNKLSNDVTIIAREYRGNFATAIQEYPKKD